MGFWGTIQIKRSRASFFKQEISEDLLIESRGDNNELIHALKYSPAMKISKIIEEVICSKGNFHSLFSYHKVLIIN